MDKFIMKKSADANIYKSIRFSTEINDKINSIVNKANEGKEKKEYSFNGFKRIGNKSKNLFPIIHINSNR